MQVSVEDVSSVKKILHIEIPEEEVSREIDNAYKELRKTAKIKGFRPGKVPRKVLENHYKKNVDADISSKLVQESFVEALKDKNYNVVGDPNINTGELKYKEPYKYDVTLELMPELDDIDFKGLSLKKNMYQATDEEVELQLKALQTNMAKHEPLTEKRAVQDNDFVLIDYEGFKDGQPFEHAQTTENYTMKIGAAQIAKEIDENLIGMNPEETKEITVSFPEDYPNKNFANETLTFKVLLKDIRQESFPEINDEFAKLLGPFENLDSLKQEIMKNLNQGYEKRTEQELSEQIFSALLEKQDFEVPEVMINYELDGIVKDAEKSFSFHNVSMEEIGVTQDTIREKYRDVALNQVKRHIILNKIISQESLTLSDEETDKGIEEMAASVNNPAAVIKEIYKKDPKQLEYLQHTLLEKKAMNLIISNSDIKEVELEIEKNN